MAIEKLNQKAKVEIEKKCRYIQKMQCIWILRCTLYTYKWKCNQRKVMTQKMSLSLYLTPECWNCSGCWEGATYFWKCFGSFSIRISCSLQCSIHQAAQSRPATSSPASHPRWFPPWSPCGGRAACWAGSPGRRGRPATLSTQASAAAYDNQSIIAVQILHCTTFSIIIRFGILPVPFLSSLLLLNQDLQEHRRVPETSLFTSFDFNLTEVVHNSFDVLPSGADQGSCAHKCVRYYFLNPREKCRK